MLAPDELTRAFRDRLARGLPGRTAQVTLEPELAYGRHFGQHPSSARVAGVLLLFYLHPAGWRIPLMLRPANLSNHPGQVSLPGGMVEPGESICDTALREMEEELGVRLSAVHVVGSLSPIYTFNSHVAITPWLAVLDRPPTFTPNAAEVAELIEMPVARLFDPSAYGSHVEQRGGLKFRAPHLMFQGHRIWGATAMILAELAAVVREMPLSDFVLGDAA